MTDTNTKALIETIHNYRVDFISCPGVFMPVEPYELVRACSGRGTALEVNTGHDYNKEELIHAAAHCGARLVINSDAHCPQKVGDLALGLALVERLRFPAEKIINAVQ